MNPPFEEDVASGAAGPLLRSRRLAAEAVRWRPALLVALAVWGAGVAIGLPLPALAQTAVTAENRRFMGDVAESGMLEIVLGRVAEEKAASDAVRQFATHMVDDHNKANEELKAIAAAKSVPLPTGLSSDQKAYVSKMKKVKGAGFDRAYMTRMLDDHRRAVTLFERAGSAAGDPDVKAYAARNLPVMRSHLEMAQQTSSGLAATAKAVPHGAVKGSRE